MNASPWTLDEQTRRDLDLDAVEAALADTYSTYGDHVLGQRLGRQPRSRGDAAAWSDRLAAVRADTELRARAERQLRRLGKQRRGHVFDDLAEGLAYRPELLPWMPLWFVAAPVLTVVAALTLGPWALFGALAPALANLGLYLVTNPHIGSHAGSLQYLSRGLGVLHRLGLLSPPELSRLRRYAGLFQDGTSASVSGDLISMVLDYLRVFLGAELLAYSQVAGLFERYRAAVPAAMQALGDLDVQLSLARRLDADDGWTTATWSDRPGVRFTALGHPLVENPVTQSFELTSNLVITGMNMAGKSTFLKSVALNQLLATSLGIARAQTFETSGYLVMTSLNLADDVLTGRSRYYVEAERLLQVQQALEGETLLCLIDEILTGTNTDDRIFASLGLLTNFARHGGSLILAATHDTAIAQGLEGLYQGLCFDGEWDDGRLVFDYQPRPGVQTRRNALKLLEMLGLDYQVPGNGRA